MSLENKKGKYDYLKKYINNHEATFPSNWFIPITQEEINQEEKRLGRELPSCLKEFWLEIGCGSLQVSVDKEYTDGNRILYPDEVVDIALYGEESEYIIYDAAELLCEGDIVFFEVGDSEHFLVMNQDTKYPNGVYDGSSMSEEAFLVEPSFEDFIWRLYYEHPIFFCKRHEPEYECFTSKKELLLKRPDLLKYA